eukprot:scaffold46287_cov38-Prasinocladus_malaysianus.AAC.2
MAGYCASLRLPKLCTALMSKIALLAMSKPTIWSDRKSNSAAQTNTTHACMYYAPGLSYPVYLYTVEQALRTAAPPRAASQDAKRGLRICPSRRIILGWKCA